MIKIAMIGAGSVDPKRRQRPGTRAHGVPRGGAGRSARILRSVSALDARDDRPDSRHQPGVDSILTSFRNVEV